MKFIMIAAAAVCLTFAGCGEKQETPDAPKAPAVEKAKPVVEEAKKAVDATAKTAAEGAKATVEAAKKAVEAPKAPAAPAAK